MTSAVRCSVGRPVVADGSVAAGFSGAGSGGRSAIGEAGGTAGLVEIDPGERDGVVLASGGAVCAGDGGGGVAAVGRGGWTGGLVGAGARSSPVSAAGEVTGRAPNRVQPSSPLGTRTLDHASCSSKIVNSILLAAGTVAMIAYCSPGPARNVMDGRSPVDVAAGLTGAGFGRRAPVNVAGGTAGLAGVGARSSPVSTAGEITGRAPNRIQPSSPLGTRTLDHASCSSKIVNSILLAAGTVAMIAYCSPGPARNVMDGRSPEEAGTGARTRASMHIHRDADNHVQARRRSRYLDDIACSFSHLWSLRPLIHSLADAPETDHSQHLCQFTP